MSLTTTGSTAQQFAGRYNLLRQIGVNTGGGAAGEAWLARDTQSNALSDELVVVKMSTYDSGTIYQVRTEARVLQRLREVFERSGAGSPRWTGRAIPVPYLFAGPVPIHDRGNARASDNVDRPVYLVEEYLTEPFVALPELARGRSGWAPFNALELAEALAEVLKLAHQVPIVHGDLNDRKVEHIFWDPRGRRLKVIDWGIADDAQVVERRHLPNDDIQGLGTLFHYMMTGEPYGRGSALPDWADRIVRSCLEQDPAHATLDKPISAIDEALRWFRGQIDASARELLAAASRPSSRGAAEQVRIAADRLSDLDPYHALLSDTQVLTEGRDAIAAIFERFEAQLAGSLTLFAVASGDQTNARTSATGVAASARDLATQVSRVQALDRAAQTAVAGSLATSSVPGSVLTIDWDQIATIFDRAARGTFTFHAPAGLSAEPWASFSQSLRSLELPRAAELLTVDPSLADPDPFRSALRAPELRYLLLAAWYRVHPLTDIERHVGFARAWSGVQGNVTAMSRATLERWLALLDSADEATRALREARSPAELASRWRSLIVTVRGLHAESPVRVSHDAPLDDAIIVMERVEQQIDAVVDVWAAGRYEQLGQAVDALALDLPELGEGLAAWTSSGQRLRECLGHADRLQEEIAAAARAGSDLGQAAGPMFGHLDALQELDPGAPWHVATRSALAALVDLGHEAGSPARRRLGAVVLGELATVLAQHRPWPEDPIAASQIGQAIRSCAVHLSGALDDAAVSAYERDAAGLGPLRPAFDAELAGARASLASQHLDGGAWGLAAEAFADAARLVDPSGQGAGGVHAANAQASEATTDAFEALIAGRFDLAAERATDARNVTGASRAVSSRVTDATGAIERVVRQARGLSDALRGGSISRNMREATRTIWSALDDPSVPAAVREAIEPIITACDEALSTGYQSAELVRLGQSLTPAEQNEWRELIRRLARAVPPLGSTQRVAAAAGGGRAGMAGPARAGAAGGGRVTPRAAMLVGGICLVVLLLGGAALMMSRSSSQSAGAGQGVAQGPSATATPRVLTAPQPGEGEKAEREVDGVVTQAKQALAGDKPDADKAVALLDELSHRLPLDSKRRPEVDDLMIQALLDDADRRVGAALTLKDRDGGKESRGILTEADDRIKRAADVRPKDADLQARAARAHDQVELAGWWMDFNVAYQANNPDAQIPVLQRIIAKQPDYAPAEGSAKDKLYAAWIAKANQAGEANKLDEAAKDLDEAAKVLPGHPLTDELRAKWSPKPTEVPTQVAAPPTPVPAQVQPVQVAPAAKPVAPAPVAPKPQIVPQPQAPAVVAPPAAEPVQAAPPAPAPAAKPEAPQVLAPVIPAAKPEAAPPPPEPKPAAPPPVAKPAAPPPQAEQPRRPSIDAVVGGGAGGGGNGGNSSGGGGDSNNGGGSNDGGGNSGGGGGGNGGGGN